MADVTVSSIPLSSHDNHRACVFVGTFNAPETHYLFNLSAYRSDTQSLENAFWSINSDCSMFMMYGFYEDTAIVASTDPNTNLVNIPDHVPVLRDLCAAS